LKALAGLAFGLALTATSAQAQAQACVKNDASSTVYSSRLKVIGHNGSVTYTGYSTQILGGGTKCYSLSERPDIATYTIEIWAYLGKKDVPCTPINRAIVVSNVTRWFSMKGVTVDPRCFEV
jgi:hypothetical protein